MLFGFDDFDRTCHHLDELHRRLDAALAPSSELGFGRGDGWLRLSAGEDTLELRADLPGVALDDVDLTLHDDVLTVTASRKVSAPEGFGKVHLNERRGWRLTRSVALPVRVDPERVGARMRDGVLTVTLHKAEAARPRPIAVQRD